MDLLHSTLPTPPLPYPFTESFGFCERIHRMQSVLCMGSGSGGVGSAAANCTTAAV